jgi:multiple sugar transport system permease protein
MIDVWEWSPMVALIILAGLSSISDDIYEAATVDGANYIQKVFRITLPLSLNTILTAALLRLIDVLKTFDIIYSTTAGGPAFQSQTINIYSYLYGFQYYKYGYASASMVVFTVLVLAVAGIVMVIRAKAVVDR